MKESARYLRQLLSDRTLVLIMLVALSLVIRLVLAFGCRAAPDFSDMETYNRLALQGGISVVPPPGYPLFLRVIYGVFGPRNYLAVFIVQGIVSALTVGLIFLVAEKAANFRTAVIAAAVSAVYPNFLVYNLTVMSETLGLFLTMLLFWFLLSGIRQDVKACGSALLLVASCAVRPVMIYFWPGMLAGLRRKMLFIITTALIVTPWVIYSVSSGNVTNRPGRAFYKTYNPKSNGKQFVKFSETELSREDLPNRVYFRKAFDFIIHNKWKTLDIIYNKGEMIFSRGWDQHFMERIVGAGNKKVFLMIYSFIPVMLLGMAGIIMYVGEKNRVLAYMLLSYLLCFILFAIFKVRYRLLVEPVFIIYSAIFVDRAIRNHGAGSDARRGGSGD
jgi:4-amino-4-deoxy-L-arabinose transferase-like glycosyltransferase